MLSDLGKAERAVEKHHRVGAALQQDLAGHARVAQLGVALRVGVERATDAAAATAARHHDAIDVEELGMPFLEPAEVRAVVAGGIAHADQEAGQRAVALGHAEILRTLEEILQAVRIQRQDRGSGGVVQG